MSPKKEILVIGMGAVGTMAAYALQASQLATVTAVLRSNHDIVEEKGFTINSVDHGTITNWKPDRILNTVPNVKDKTHHYHLYHQRYDYIVLTTKNTPDVGRNLVDLVAPAVTTEHTSIVLMQNGLNIEVPFQKRFPKNAIISCVQLIGASEVSPGVILHNEPDISHVGLWKPDGLETVEDYFVDVRKMAQSENADAFPVTRFVNQINSTTEFIQLYNACGVVQCHHDKEVRKTRWRKLIYNAAYNSVSAILGLDVTRLRIQEHPIENLVKPIMQEIITIAYKDGIKLWEDPMTPDQLVHHWITVDNLSSWFVPSMAQDAAKNNYLEFENIIGEPLRIAQQLKVDCPTLTVIYGILKGLQDKIREKKGVLTVGIDMARQYR